MDEQVRSDDSEIPTLYSSVDKFSTQFVASAAIAILGWLAVAIGVIGLLAAFNSGEGMAIMFAVPSCGALIMMGLLLVVAGQVGRSTQQTANNTQVILELMRSRDEEVD